MALPTLVWTMGWRVLRASRGLGGVEVVVCHTVPPLDGLLCCARCSHHGGPRLCCGVERAGQTLVRWCRLLCARAPCCAGSVPGRRRPAHICAESLSMLCVCGYAEPEHVVCVWDGAGVGNPAGGASAAGGLMA